MRSTSRSKQMSKQSESFCEYHYECNGCEHANGPECNQLTCPILQVYRMTKKLEEVEQRVDTLHLTII